MLESSIENYLINCVEECGGQTRKLRWIGRRSAPDRLVLFPGFAAFVELKRPGEKATAPQQREHQILREAGLHVGVLDSTFGVERFVTLNKF